MKKPKRKHPVYISDPRGTKFNVKFSTPWDEEEKQKQFEEKLRRKRK